jgi:VWFA-related protein
VGWKFVFILSLGIAVSPSWAQTADNAAKAETFVDSHAGAAASSDTSADGEIPTIRASVREVNVIFSATDKKGHYKKDLTAKDLTVTDDGKPPAAVRSFSSETDLPIRAGLVLDVSGSITDRFTFEQDSAIKFFGQTLRANKDQAFVLAFDSVPTLTQDFTDNPELLASGVKKLSPGGGSAVYDAMYVAATKKLQTVSANGPIRRIIVLISDGEDNQSSVTIPQLIEAARRAEVTIYAVSTNTSGIKTRGDKVLQKLADETGGRVFFPEKVDDVVKAFNTIQDELRSQYALSYKPADFDNNGQYRRIEIRPTNDKNIVIRARKGYFAPGPQSANDHSQPN